MFYICNFYGIYELSRSISFIFQLDLFYLYKLILCQMTNKLLFISDASLFADECQTDFSVAPVPFAVLCHSLVADGHLAQPE